MPTLAGVSPDTESKLKAKPATIQSWQQKNIAQEKKEEDEKEIARKAKRALYARERRARIKREREEAEAAKNKNEIDGTQDHVGSDVVEQPPKKKKKVSIPPPKTHEDTNKKQQQVSVEQAVGHQGQFVKVRLKLPTGTQKFGFSLRDDVQSYGLPVLSSLLYVYILCYILYYVMCILQSFLLSQHISYVLYFTQIYIYNIIVLILLTSIQFHPI